MTKPIAVPKDLDDLKYHFDIYVRTEGDSCILRDGKTERDKRGRIGRFVPDEMLRERFAFAGEVKLTREEVGRLMSINSYNDLANATVEIIKSKLSAAHEKPCEPSFDVIDARTMENLVRPLSEWLQRRDALRNEKPCEHEWGNKIRHKNPGVYTIERFFSCIKCGIPKP